MLHSDVVDCLCEAQLPYLEGSQRNYTLQRLHCNPIFCYSSSYISLTQLNSLDPDTNVNHTGEIAYDCFIENQFNEILTNEYYSGAFLFCILIPAVFQTILTI